MRLTINTKGVESYGDGVPHIFTHHYTTSGADGRFVFERVFPGDGRIGRAIVFEANDGATEFASSPMVAASFPAGKTTHFDLGGSGRPVIGKLAQPAGITAKVLWQFALMHIEVDLPEPKRPPIPADIKDVPERRRLGWPIGKRLTRARRGKRRIRRIKGFVRKGL